MCARRLKNSRVALREASAPSCEPGGGLVGNCLRAEQKHPDLTAARWEESLLQGWPAKSRVSESVWPYHHYALKLPYVQRLVPAMEREIQRFESKRGLLLD